MRFVNKLLIKSYCTSFYCGYMWSDYKKTTYSKLRVAFNDVYWREGLLGLSYWSSASTMYTTHNINNMEALLMRSIYSFIKRLLDSCVMRPYTEGRLDRYRIGIPRELSEIRIQPWLSEGSLTCEPCHHRGPIV